MPLQWLVFTDMRKATVGHPHRLHCQGRKGAGPSPTADGHFLTRLFLGHPLVPVPNFPRVTHLPDLEQWELTGCFYQPGSHRASVRPGDEGQGVPTCAAVCSWLHQTPSGDNMALFSRVLSKHLMTQIHHLWKY